MMFGGIHVRQSLSTYLIQDLPSLDKRLQDNWETFMTSGIISKELRGK